MIMLTPTMRRRWTLHAAIVNVAGIPNMIFDAEAIMLFVIMPRCVVKNTRMLKLLDATSIDHITMLPPLKSVYVQLKDV